MIIVIFLSAVWMRMRIHWWESNVMLNFSKSVTIKKQTHLHLGLPEGEYILSTFVSTFLGVPLAYDLFSRKESNFYRVGRTWEWVNDNRIVICRWIISLTQVQVRVTIEVPKPMTWSFRAAPCFLAHEEPDAPAPQQETQSFCSRYIMESVLICWYPVGITGSSPHAFPRIT